MTKKPERIAELMSRIYDVAVNGEREEVRLQAMNALLNRLDGMPVARVEQHTTGEMVQRVISGEPLTVDEWAERYAPKAIEVEPDGGKT